MMKEILEEKKIRGPVLDVATFLSIPAFSQIGTKIIPPPIPTQPPKIPVSRPFIIPSLICFSDIFSLGSAKT